MPLPVHKALTGHQRAKRLVALVFCTILGFLLGVARAEPLAYSRNLEDMVTLRKALVVGVQWVVIGVLSGLVFARILQSARIPETAITLALIFLLWSLLLAGTPMSVR